MRRRLGLSGLFGLCLIAAAPLTAAAMETVRLVLEQHRFEPAEATVKAGERFRIEVTNRDPTPSEIESSDMRIEKIVPAGATVTVMAGPLKPGRYRFFDEYHPETAKGTIVAASKD
jgi:plastocyanin